MRNFSRNTAFRAAAISSVSLLVAAAIAPGAIAADTVDGDVKVSNTETVQVLMDASGKIDSKRVYEQLVLTGKGKVDIANPVSTDGLRNLDGFGGFDVRDGKVRVKTDVSGTKKYRSVSNFTKKLPLDIQVTYLFDGKEVEPGDVVGKSGDLEVRYRVTNNTGVAKDVPFKDGNGNDQTSQESVVVPMVGSLTTTLPSSFTKVQSAEANAAGDGRGGTTLSFTMTLIPPIGNDFAEFGYKAQIKDGVIPKASISALPVNPLESPSFKGGADSYKGGATTGSDLTAGATEIDANVLKLRDGANDLVAGLLQLNDGAAQLNAGLKNDAAPGAQKLAAGAGKLDAGAKKLAGGTGELSEGAGKLNKGANSLAGGLEKANSGAPALLEGVDKLSAGAKLVDAGLVTLQESVSAGVGTPGEEETLRYGVAQLLDGLGDEGAIQSGLDQVDGALSGALAAANSLDDAAPQKVPLIQAISGAKGGVAQVKGGINNLILPGLTQVDGGLQQLNSEVAAGVGAPAADKTLRNGVAQLIGGLGQLKTEGGKLVDGLGELSDGANQLSAGTDDLESGANKLNDGAGTLKGGTGELSDGAGKLSTGLGTAVDGSGKLSEGLEKAADGAPDLPEGAERLSKEGTSKLVEAGDATAMDYGLKYALISAGAERAGAAQPYGSPKGANALTAFKFELAGADGAGTANATRGIAAIALLAGTAVIAAIRRKGII